MKLGDEPLIPKYVEMGGYDCMTDAQALELNGTTVAVIDEALFRRRIGPFSYDESTMAAEAADWAALLAHCFNCLPAALDLIEEMVADQKTLNLEFRNKAILERAERLLAEAHQIEIHQP